MNKHTIYFILSHRIEITFFKYKEIKLFLFDDISSRSVRVDPILVHQKKNGKSPIVVFDEKTLMQEILLCLVAQCIL